MKLVLASSNSGKLKEFRELFRGENRVTVTAQSEFGVSDADETGLSFIENALIKARHASECTGMPAVADDSGLVVHALDGAPGIYSARYAGKGSSSEEKIAMLLQQMQDVPGQQRQAFYYSALALVRSAKDQVPIICEAAWHGSITLSPKGDKGFGYDPIFWVEEYQCTAAELDIDVKSRICHRGQSTQLLLDRIKQELKV